MGRAPVGVFLRWLPLRLPLDMAYLWRGMVDIGTR